jgi:hypothetical protein
LRSLITKRQASEYGAEEVVNLVANIICCIANGLRPFPSDVDYLVAGVLYFVWNIELL